MMLASDHRVDQGNQRMRLVTIATLMVLTSSIAGAATPPVPIVVQYDCPGGRGLTVEFHGNDHARVRPTLGKVSDLPAMRSGSVFRYGNGRQQLFGKGRDVLWTAHKGASPVTCTQRRN
jgi:Membrane-bound lysozyme-inhibitor of c-type lysozyme